MFIDLENKQKIKRIWVYRTDKEYKYTRELIPQETGTKKFQQPVKIYLILNVQ